MNPSQVNTEFLFINGSWVAGEGPALISINPSTNQPIWEGKSATDKQVKAAIAAARSAQVEWASVDVEKREECIRNFGDQLELRRESFATQISLETGKPLWEARTEVAAMIGKIEVSITAYHERTGSRRLKMSMGDSILRHKPHGVVAVFGPYNFPGHLPNGHIIPALLAGNTVVFKPSELVPSVAAMMVEIWSDAGLPKGVLNLVQGEKEVGVSLSQNPDIDGLFFTGSSNTGRLLHEHFCGQPSKILALEMGGNNPLILTQMDELRPLVHDVIHSSFITSGQRCTCARRLFVPSGDWGDRFLQELIKAVLQIKVGRWNDADQPFMGPVISMTAAEHLMAAWKNLQTLGGQVLCPMQQIEPDTSLLSPGVIDVTKIKELPDEEYFGPMLQVIRYHDFDLAINVANRTRFGLAAGIYCYDREQFDTFFRRIRAGIVNWNRPTTGASSAVPFGGIGDSGNHRPSAYYAADYCAYPVACIESEEAILPTNLAPGLTL